MSSPSLGKAARTKLTVSSSPPIWGNGRTMWILTSPQRVGRLHTSSSIQDFLPSSSACWRSDVRSLEFQQAVDLEFPPSIGGDSQKQTTTNHTMGDKSPKSKDKKKGQKQNMTNAAEKKKNSHTASKKVEKTVLLPKKKSKK